MLRFAGIAFLSIAFSVTAHGQKEKLLMDTPEHTIQSLWTTQIRRDTTHSLSLEQSNVLLTPQAHRDLEEFRKAHTQKMKFELLRGRNRFVSVRIAGPHAIVDTEEYLPQNEGGVPIRYELVKEFGEWKISTSTFHCSRCTRGIDKQGYPCDKCNGTGWLNALPLLLQR